MVPYTFIENDRVTAVPTEDMSFPFTAGRPSKPSRLGPGAPGFEARDVLPTLARKAAEIIGNQTAAAKGGKPFFLYLPLTAPHTPIAPSAEWQGKSGLSPYADFVMETDWAVGEVLRALEEHGLSGNTLVMFTSDNGCAPSADFADLAAHGHHPSYVSRGTKADIFDGGHHIPFIVRLPGKVPAGATSAQMTCLTDLMATCAEVVGTKLPANVGEDSVSMWMAMQGKSDKPVRQAMVHHSVNGSFAIRFGDWKLELCSSSGGWSDPKPNTAAAKKLPPVQLYDLKEDIGETKNLQAEHPEVVAQLTKLLEQYVADGRSTPGAPQKNAVPINLWKEDGGAATNKTTAPAKTEAAQ
jgi:arylsulfatase A-like enzyme